MAEEGDREAVFDTSCLNLYMYPCSYTFLFLLATSHLLSPSMITHNFLKMSSMPATINTSLNLSPYSSTVRITKS